MSSLFKMRAVLTSALFAASATFSLAHAEMGVHADKIVFGQSAAFDGPAASLGTGMRQGIEAAFAEANAAGGVNGRKLELVAYDDGYEPDRAIENTKKLIDQDHVFALIGGVGTPTSKAAQPIAKETGVPFIAPFTGAGFLRDPANKHVINLRASYDQEAELWIERLTSDLGAKSIGIVYQDDSFGRAGLSGVKKALEKRGMALAAEGTYTRNTTDVKKAVLAMKKASPDAVVMVGAYKPLAEFIRVAKKVGVNGPFLNISFVGSKALADDLGADGDGVIITQVVPYFGDTAIPLVAEYHAALKASAPDAAPGFVSLEGYMAGRLAIEALKKTGNEFDRAKFIQTFYDTGRFDLSGIELVFGEGDNQGMSEVFLTRVKSGGSFDAIATLN